MKPALLFYCQHSVGLGHLMRSYALCERLADRFRVVLLCGGELPEGIAPPKDVELIPLPPLGVSPGEGFRSGDPRLTVEHAWAIREQRILDALHEARPAVVLVELFPFGRAKFAREITPLLEAARAGGAMTACSVRDILVSSRDDQRAHDDRARERADAFLDAVLVHCDPRFARLEETFKPTVPLSVPVRYTGFVARPPAPERERGDHILVSAGGGRVGAPLMLSAMAASDGRAMKVVAGPLMPDENWRGLQRLRPSNVELVRSVPDLAAELQVAAASVSQCGYNTALDLIRTRVPALVVPYVTAEENEQTRRARRLAELGVLQVADHINGQLPNLLQFQPAPAGLDLDGAARTTDLLWEMAT
jgi:predicted glycosyltransferase